MYITYISATYVHKSPTRIYVHMCLYACMYFLVYINHKVSWEKCRYEYPSKSKHSNDVKISLSRFKNTHTHTHTHTHTYIYIYIYIYQFSPGGYLVCWSNGIRRLPLCKGVRSLTLTLRNEFPGYETKPHLMMKLQSWKFGECGVPPRWHYSLLHSDTE